MRFRLLKIAVVYLQLGVAAGLSIGFCIGLFLLFAGNALGESFVRVGALTTFAGVLMFTINVVRTVRLAGPANANAGTQRGFAAHLGEWR